MCNVLESLQVNNLTPVEEYNGVFYKRDDLFMPFKDIPLTGGKVRQALYLMASNQEKILHAHKGRVITCTQLTSPQGLIVARVAHELGFRSVIVVGATKIESLKKHSMMVLASKYGAKFDIKSKMAYNLHLNKRIDDINETSKFPYFNVGFGINLENNSEALINSVSNQVENIPKDIDILVIPSGSCITAGGILLGLKRFNVKPRFIYIVQIAGYYRRTTIDSLAPNCTYEYIADKSYPYSKSLDVTFNAKGEWLDSIYEAKAYMWMMKNLDVKKNKTLFWIVGNTKAVRNFTLP